MEITKETVEYVASLAHLTITEEEKEHVAKKLEQILDYMAVMNELDTTGIEPMSHVLELKNVFRQDVVVNGDNRDQILKNAPKSKDGSFVVPKTVE